MNNKFYITAFLIDLIIIIGIILGLSLLAYNTYLTKQVYDKLESKIGVNNG